MPKKLKCINLLNCTVAYLLIGLSVHSVTSEARTRPSPAPLTREEWTAKFPNGRALFLYGNLTNSEQQQSVRRVSGFWGQLSSQGYEVEGPLPTTAEGLLRAFQDPDVSLIVWESHGTPEGLAEDYSKIVLVEYLLHAPGARLRYFLVPTCYGSSVIQKLGLNRFPQIMSWGPDGPILAMDVFPLAREQFNIFQKETDPKSCTGILSN